MSRHYKNVKNGLGTDLIISDDKYISVGKDGADVTIRGNGIVAAFDTWEEFVNSIELSKATYFDKYDSLRIFEKNILDRVDKKIDTSLFELEVVDFIDSDHLDCLWYGGTVATVKYKGNIFSLEARGDVSATLLDEENNEFCYVKDKRNGGCFYEQIKGYLKNDNELHKAVEENRLVFGDNNWYEIFVTSPECNFYDLQDVCSSDDMAECIIEMIENMDEIIKYIKEK